MKAIRSFGLFGSVLTAAGLLGACGDTASSLVGGGPETYVPSDVLDGGSPSGDELPDPATCTETIPTAQSRRITKAEYESAIESVFHLGIRVTGAFPPDPVVRGFDNNVEALVVSSTLSRHFLDAAEQVSAEVTKRLAGAVGCTADKLSTESCVRSFIGSKGKLAWRRPLSAEESDALFGAFAAWTADGGDVASGYQLVIERILNSTNFLYRSELGVSGTPGQIVPLSGPELAARLSYLLWGTSPDEQLIDSITTTPLDSDEVLLGKVDSMLADPRAKAGLRTFHERVFSLTSLDTIEKSSTAYPSFTESHAASMKEEIFRMTEAAWQKGDVASMFTTTSTSVDSNLAGYYGVSAPASGFSEISMNPSQRRGILTTPGMMAILAKSNESAPIRRGAYVREMIFCQHLEAPSGLAVTPPKADPNLTARQQLTTHRADPACAGCHNLMDPVGLSFEHFDGVGMWRETENSHTIDVRDTLQATDVNGEFNGATELAEKIASSALARTCYSRHVFRWTMGRLEDANDACTIAKVSDAFIRSNNNPRELIHALVKSPAFRTVRLPEVSQ